MKKENQNSNFLIKNIIPISAITIILIGLVFLFIATGTKIIITDPMKVGIGYLISGVLTVVYNLEKNKKSIYSQIVMSTIIASFMLTTIIGTDVFYVIPKFLGLILVILNAIVGLEIARRKQSELEFISSAIVAAIIPIVYVTNSLISLIISETVVFFGLFVYLKYYQIIKRSHHITFTGWLVSLVVMNLTFLSNSLNFNLNLNINFFTLILLISLNAITLIIPVYYKKLNIIKPENVRKIKLFLLIGAIFINILLIQIFNLMYRDIVLYRLALFASMTELVLVLISYDYFTNEVKNSNLDMHIASYLVLVIFGSLLIDDFKYSLIYLTSLTAAHQIILNLINRKTLYPNWSKTLKLFFGLLVAYQSAEMIFGILSFLLGGEYIPTHSLFLTIMRATNYIFALWAIYILQNSERGYSYNKPKLFMLSVILTVLYFLYIPWQIINVITNDDGTVKLVLISVMWMASALYSIYRGMKVQKIGYRIFTISTYILLTIKLFVVDMPFFVASGQSVGLSIYIIVYGLASVGLSRLLIAEYSHNGRLTEQWTKIKQTFKVQNSKQGINKPLIELPIKVQQPKPKINQPKILQLLNEPIELTPTAVNTSEVLSVENDENDLINLPETSKNIDLPTIKPQKKVAKLPQVKILSLLAKNAQVATTNQLNDLKPSLDLKLNAIQTQVPLEKQLVENEAKTETNYNQQILEEILKNQQIINERINSLELNAIKQSQIDNLIELLVKREANDQKNIDFKYQLIKKLMED